MLVPGPLAHFDGQVDLGAGDDVSFWGWWSMPVDVPHVVFVQGGAGDDDIRTEWGDLLAPLSMTLSGMEGNDEIAMSFIGVMPGGLHATADLGAGNDSFLAHVQQPVMDERPPPSHVQIDAFGQGGMDSLHFYLTGAEPGREPLVYDGSLAVNLDGGLGNDTFGVGLGSDQSAPLDLNGPLAVNVNGGGGSENSVIAIINVALQGTLDAAADWGPGNDFTEWVFEDVVVAGSLA